MALKNLIVLFLLTSSFINCSNVAKPRNEPIDSDFLEAALDAEECERQITAIRGNTMLLLEFADSGLRIPSGILTGNTVDLGNYHQCLGIDHQLADTRVEGKYCSIRVPFNQSFELPFSDMQLTHFNPSNLRLDQETISKIEEYNVQRRIMLAFSGDYDGFKHDARSMPGNPLETSIFRLAVCIPKPCTTEQAINSLFFNTTAIGFRYTEDYCRIPGDKTWVASDYIVIVVFSVLVLVTVLSTAYDLINRLILKKGVKQMSVIYRSFSVYTNGQRLMTFSPGVGNLQCLDGIRTISIIWIIIGHSFSSEPLIANAIDYNSWMLSSNALWVTIATICVDTFFAVAGVLLVYTTVGKMNQVSFLKNIHWFYLNRYMRITPLLAMNALLQASYYNRIVDGPHWSSVGYQVSRCRENWWSTLLHVQNFVHPNERCITHSWYVAIDFQLYVLSPLILLWVLTGKKHLAWTGLLGGLTAVLIAATIYCFQINMPADSVVPTRLDVTADYFRLYYTHTLPRAAPFLVGLIFGYILHLYRKKEMRISWMIVILFWACSAGIFGGIIYFQSRIRSMDWDNQLMDNLMNSFMRPAYAVAICWLIVACVHGYGGPINWFLSLEIWRLPARLSYGIYLFHYPLMFSLNATMVAPAYFSVGGFAFKALAYIVLSLGVSFFFTLTLDSPVSVLFKVLMDSGKRKALAPKTKETPNDSDKSSVPKNSNGVHDVNNKSDGIVPDSSELRSFPYKKHGDATAVPIEDENAIITYVNDSTTIPIVPEVK